MQQLQGKGQLLPQHLPGLSVPVASLARSGVPPMQSKQHYLNLYNTIKAHQSTIGPQPVLGETTKPSTCPRLHQPPKQEGKARRNGLAARPPKCQHN